MAWDLSTRSKCLGGFYQLLQVTHLQYAFTKSLTNLKTTPMCCHGQAMSIILAILGWIDAIIQSGDTSSYFRLTSFSCGEPSQQFPFS